MRKHKLTHRAVKVLIVYDPNKGSMVWCRRMRGWFKTDSSWKAWNTQYAWQPAMTYIANGHRSGTLLGEHYLAARVAYFYMKGRWPNTLAFHNGNPKDIRWCNLVNCKSASDARDYMRYQSGKRMGTVSKTSSGRWKAKVGTFYVGTFDKRWEALDANIDIAHMRWWTDRCT